MIAELLALALAFGLGAAVDPVGRVRTFAARRRARATCRLCGDAKGAERAAYVLCQRCADGFAAEGGAAGEADGWPKEAA